MTTRAEDLQAAGEAVDAFVAEREDELVQLVRTLVGFETVSVDLSPGSEHRENQEAELQAFVAERLGALGARVDSFEPDAAALADHPMMPPWHHWKGRPITVATLRGAGGGRSLIVNGHIDVVSPGDLGRWTTPPFAADVRDGRIYGRGAVDMKGGVAAAIFALEALAAAGVRLARRRDRRDGPGRGDVRHGHRGGDRARLPRRRGPGAGADAARLLDRHARAPARRGARARPLRARGDEPAGLAGRRRRQRDREGAAGARGAARAHRRLGGARREGAPAARPPGRAADDHPRRRLHLQRARELRDRRQRHLPARRRRRRRLRQRAARRDPRRGGRGGRAGRLARGAPAGVDVGHGLPAVGDRPGASPSSP